MTKLEKPTLFKRVDGNTLLFLNLLPIQLLKNLRTVNETTVLCLKKVAN